MNANHVTEHLLASHAQEVEKTLLQLEDDVCRDVMGYAMHNLELLRMLKCAPYGLKGTMAYRGGLLVHVINSLKFVEASCVQARELEIIFSPSLVVMGCVLRNIGWYTTTNFRGKTPKARDSFHTIGIRRASTHYINLLAKEAESNIQIILPPTKQQVLENMCNAKEEICTFEGKLVSCADNMADAIEFGAASLQRKQIGNWRDGLFVGHLDDISTTRRST